MKSSTTLKEVVIITRKFNQKNPYGAGVSGNYAIHPMGNSLAEFWANILTSNNSYQQKYEGDDLEYEDKLTEFLKKEENSESLFLEHLNDVWSSPVDHPENDGKEGSKHLASIYQYKKDGVPTEIFVYHNWLSEQGLGNSLETKHAFLTSLRANVEEIVGEKIKVCWLIHDNDLLSRGAEGLLYMKRDEKLIGNLEKKDVPNALLNDDIWCFQHEKGSGGYYDNIILNFDRGNWSAEELIHKLKWDPNGVLRRLELLELRNDSMQIGDKELMFCLQKDPATLEIKGTLTVGELKKLINK